MKETFVIASIRTQQAFLENTVDVVRQDDTELKLKNCCH